MKTKTTILVGIVGIGIVFFLVSVMISLIGHRKSDIPVGTYAYKMNGKYYYKSRGNYPLAEPEKEITKDRYRTFMAYRRASRILGGIGMPMALIAFGYLIISRCVRAGKLWVPPGE